MKRFPIIKHINDVLPYVKDVEEICHSVKEADGFQVLNYVYVTPNTFETPQALECRGIKFDLDGNIIARPFHKFFNLFEREQPHELDWSKVIDVQIKEDGSMIHPVILNGELHLMTRMGLSDVALQAEEEALTPRLREEMLMYIERGFTPLYEYVSPNNRIVIKYEKPELRLLAIREIITGRYVQFYPDDLLYNAGVDFSSLAANVKSWSDCEGVVATFHDGHRIKIKADDYVLLHKTKSMLEREINVVRCILEGSDDDLIAVCNEEDRERLKEFIAAWKAAALTLTIRMKNFIDSHREKTQKDFALFVQSQVMPKNVQGLAFMMRKAEPSTQIEAHKITMSYLNKRLTKQDRVDEMSDYFKEARWTY